MLLMNSEKALLYLPYRQAFFFYETFAFYIYRQTFFFFLWRGKFRLLFYPKSLRWWGEEALAEASRWSEAFALYRVTYILVAWSMAAAMHDTERTKNDDGDVRLYSQKSNLHPIYNMKAVLLLMLLLLLRAGATAGVSFRPGWWPFGRWFCMREDGNTPPLTQ